jgi:hypothetical protein
MILTMSIVNKKTEILSVVNRYWNSVMKLSRMFAVVSLVVLNVTVVTPAIAAVPQVINYQGNLTDGGGAPVADGAQLMKFTIYDAAVGGSALWNSGFQNVTTTNGLFTYDLGSNVALPDNLFTDTSRYLGIAVGVDPEISPRTRLETAPYAYHALRADSATVAGLSPGVTQELSNGSKQIFAGFAAMMVEDSINCPDSGYVIVDASFSITCFLTNGDPEIAIFAWVDSVHNDFLFYSNVQHLWALPSVLPSGNYATFASQHAVFPVDGGWNSFRLLASDFQGISDRCVMQQDVIFTLLYVPKNYGGLDAFIPSVTPPSPPTNENQAQEEKQ